MLCARAEQLRSEPPRPIRPLRVESLARIVIGGSIENAALQPAQNRVRPTTNKFKGLILPELAQHFESAQSQS